MEGIEECEFSAIYESIDDSASDGDDYVTVSQPTPYPYMCPEPKGMAPPPPATWGGPLSLKAKKPKLHQPLPPVAGNTTHLMSPALSPHVNPIPLPRKPSPGGGPLQPQRSVKYKQLGGEMHSSGKPKRPPKPGYLASKESARSTAGQSYQAPPPPQCRDYPYHKLAGQQHGQEFSTPQAIQQYQHQSSHGSAAESDAANEYDSIKETRRMIAVRKKHQEVARKRARAPEPVDSGIQMGTLPGGGGSQGFKTSTGSSEELVSSGEGRGSKSSRVVGILLSITMVSLLIAVASLALSLYSIAAISTRRMKCSQDEMFSVNNTPIMTNSIMTNPLQESGDLVSSRVIAAEVEPSMLGPQAFYSLSVARLSYIRCREACPL